MNDREEFEIEKERPGKGFLELIPRRNVVAAVFMVLLLVVVLYLKSRSGSIADGMSRYLTAPLPSPPVSPAAAPVDKGAPRVRLGPPPSGPAPEDGN